ncbi:MAG: 30S ribosomal protein S20 [Myxococcales bacterium]|nr:30S ribosomal protein S20 [Myxococcales bacterium]
MVSSTQQTSRIRRRKETTLGKRNKRRRRALGTPAFPIHPEGYNPEAADAKPVAKASLGTEQMANHPSAEKRNRQRITRTARNRSIKSAVRTKVKAARLANEAGSPEAKTKLIEAISFLDRAASKGVIHPKTASRKKARLARAAHKAASALLKT